MSAGAEPGWLAQARATADAPPRAARAPLHLQVTGGAVRIGSIEPALAERMVAAGLPLRRAPPAVGDAPIESAANAGWLIDAQANASLAAIAAWLHAAGLAGAWRGELLAVVDAAEREVAQVERAAVRALGLTTFAVHLVGYSFDGERVWVQQRAFDKATDPGLWDTLMGGQMAAGETAETALARETWEEAGLEVGALLDLRRGERLTLRRPVPEGYMVEHIDVYTARLPEGALPCNRDGEVERFESLGASTLVAWLARGAFTLEASLILASSQRRR